jgi:hypothetical protein
MPVARVHEKARVVRSPSAWIGLAINTTTSLDSAAGAIYAFKPPHAEPADGCRKENAVRKATVYFSTLLALIVLPMTGASTESIRVTIDGSADEIVVEAREAPLSAVLQQVGRALGVDIRGAELIDVSRKITGRKAGPLVDVLR